MQTFGFDDPPVEIRRPVERLTVDLIPSTSWWENVRSKMPKAEWDRLRKHSYRMANYRCEVCEGSGLEQGYRWPVECHEVWSYDEATRVQKLVRLISLCPKCHQVKHFGLAQIKGQGAAALRHLMEVNSWTKAEAEAHVRQAFAVWQQRSKIQWRLNLDAIKEL